MASSQGALRATETPESTDLTPSAGSPSQELPYSEVSDSDPTTSDYGVNEETGDLYRYPSPTLLQTAPIGVREDPPASPRRKRPAKMAAGSGGRVPKRARHQSDNEEGASASPSPSPSLPAYQPTDGRLYKTTEAHRKASIKSHRAAKERKLEEHRELRAQIPLAFQSQEVIQEGGPRREGGRLMRGTPTSRGWRGESRSWRGSKRLLVVVLVLGRRERREGRKMERREIWQRRQNRRVGASRCLDRQLQKFKITSMKYLLRVR